MLSRQTVTRLIALTLMIVTGVQYFGANAFAGSKTARKTTQQVNVDSNSVTAGKGTQATKSIDCSIQSHPDCQPRPKSGKSITIERFHMENSLPSP